jgi:hypothetical protein
MRSLHLKLFGPGRCGFTRCRSSQLQDSSWAFVLWRAAEHQTLVLQNADLCVAT